MRRLRFVLLAAVCTLAGACLWLFVLVGTKHPEPADAIVVLAGNPGRLDTGLRLVREGAAPTLAVSLEEHPDPRAITACRQRHAVCFHASPYSTRGEARAVARLARTHGWHRIVIVSSRFHLRRAELLFERCTDASVQVVPARTTLWDYVKNVPLELGKLLVQVTAERAC